MDFLVRISVTWPPDGDPALLDELRKREAEVAIELAAEGRLVRLWRIPGRWANVGIWSGADADELHAALTRLPFLPWLDIHVEPLATHPNDPGTWEVSR